MNKQLALPLVSVLCLALVLSVLPLPAAAPESEQFLAANPRTLRQGMTGADVRDLQAKLTQLGYSLGVQDGIFGTRTRQAVVAFQREQGLVADGIAGPKTMQRLNELTGNRPVGTAAPVTGPAASGLLPEEQQMIDLVNKERAAAGLRPLSVDLKLVAVARAKAQDMIDRGYFAHQSPTYGSPFDQMRAAGINYRYAGENLAGASTLARAHAGLMNSPGHRANILSPNFTHIGIGVKAGGPYGKMYVQSFVGR